MEEAFRAAGVVFLAKPLQLDELEAVLELMWLRIERDRVKSVVESGEHVAKAGIRLILVRADNRIHFIRTEDVNWFEAAGNYVRIHARGEVAMLRATLTGLQDRLNPREFVRIHKSTIVKISCIQEVQPWVGGDYIAILKTGDKLKISRNFKGDLLKTYQ